MKPTRPVHSIKGEMMTGNNRAWLDSMNRQVDFHLRGDPRRRNEPEVHYALGDGGTLSPARKMRDIVKQGLRVFGLHTPGQYQLLKWMNGNAEKLWESRSLFGDELSKTQFDAAILLRVVGHRRFYFPRTEYEEFLEIVDEQPFFNPDLPGSITGYSLKLFEIRLKDPEVNSPIRMVASRENIVLMNHYRQYILRRKNVDLSPASGDIVLDCGACIGDISLLFAGLVAPRGEVHIFDPVPLHSRYCQLQASLNPSLAPMIHINQLAVGKCTQVVNGDIGDSDKIAPGCLAIDSYSSTSLDDYVTTRRLRSVDFIKMDVEGSEMDAIEGSSETVRKYKPRLAISAYHKHEDLWTIPMKIKSLNPGYELYFGHHSPVSYESVIYAVQPSKDP